MTDTSFPTALHPIRVVAERTTLSPQVLRAWERRYGVVSPQRSASGQRLYSDEDVERLRLLQRATAAGRSIGQVAGLPTRELAALVLDDEIARVLTVQGSAERDANGAEAGLRPALDALRVLDAIRLDGVLRRELVVRGAESFVDRLAVPLLHEVGEGWARGELTVAHEHLASTVVRRVLGSLLEAVPAVPDAPVLVSATPSGEAHEFGAMLAASSAVAVGWRVVYLGADLPAADISHAARLTEARVVVLSIVHAGASPALERELRTLREQLPPEVQLLVGGRAASQLGESLKAAGAIRLETLPELRAALVRLRAQPRLSG